MTKSWLVTEEVKELHDLIAWKTARRNKIPFPVKLSDETRLKKNKGKKWRRWELLCRTSSGEGVGKEENEGVRLKERDRRKRERQKKERD